MIILTYFILFLANINLALCYSINGKWKFSVNDNGIGIASNHYERIFYIFQRLNSADQYEGYGIGLANCKKIVDLHKGEISVDSELGKGTTFNFTISNLTK